MSGVGQFAYSVFDQIQAVGHVFPTSAKEVKFKFLMRLRDAVELFTELIGTMLFALLGGVANPGGTGRDGWPAMGNGLTLAVMVYMTAKTSGGKLNPAVSFGLFVAGSMNIFRCLAEMGMQILGGVLGAAMSKYLTDGTYVSAPGCFGPNHGVRNDQVFFWEYTSTFVLVSVVFATAVDDAATGHFVSTAPLAIGLSLFACAQACGNFTGGCLNPARFLGPAIVYGCGWPYIHAYLFGQFLGGATAGILFRLRLKLLTVYKEAVEELKHMKLVEDPSAKRGDSNLELTPPAGSL